MTLRKSSIVALAACAVLAGCKSEGQIVLQQGVGITSLRSACPAIGVPAYTGDVTLFNPAGQRTQNAIDVEAFITNLRSQCDDSGDRVYAEAEFDVVATRANTQGARSVQLPYYSTVMRGGNAVVTKRIGNVTVNFANGERTATAHGKAGAFIDKAEASLPYDIREKITRERKPGDTDAALDPLNDPEVKAALDRATFELLVGFQLTEDQLAYNATR
jgi:hypothetical protein